MFFWALTAILGMQDAGSVQQYVNTFPIPFDMLSKTLHNAD
jgi:hypothetical protein